jgi:hypothetical protein
MVYLMKIILGVYVVAIGLSWLLLAGILLSPLRYLF